MRRPGIRIGHAGPGCAGTTDLVAEGEVWFVLAAPDARLSLPSKVLTRIKAAALAHAQTARYGYSCRQSRV